VPLEKGDPAMVDDKDGVNEEEEFEQWKLRQLQRMRRSAEEEAAYVAQPGFPWPLMLTRHWCGLVRAEQARAEVERRRNMTDAERAAEDRADPAKQAQPKAKMAFMQKYYHKGAFFQDQTILARDYTAPTERDRINKELLPEPMRVIVGLRVRRA
jgi:microfibrillar-associated protein 1